MRILAPTLAVGVLLLSVVEGLAPPSTTSELASIQTSIVEQEAQAAKSRRAFVAASVAAASLVATSAEASPAHQASSDFQQQPEILATSTTVDWQAIGKKASKKALGGGKAGASAAVVQVCSLMWLRTAMNYQYRYGGNLKSSLATLLEEGGIKRLYQGLPFALVQGPLTRFGDTAANVGILALLENADLPLPLKTGAASLTAGLWRIILMPVDTSKTALQVEGAKGLDLLRAQVATNGPGPLYRGAFASAGATTAGHFPWFLTYNFLDGQIVSITAQDDLLLSLARSAILGLCSSCVSDCCSNSLRVIKTTKQTAGLAEGAEDLSYIDVVKTILEDDGIGGLLFRGLQTRLLTNAVQGALFSVLWRYFQQVGALQ